MRLPTRAGCRINWTEDRPVPVFPQPDINGTAARRGRSPGSCAAYCDMRTSRRRCARGARVARALGHERQGKRLVEELKARMASIAEQSGAARTRPRGAMIEWVDPLMAGGNWMPELVQMAGGENLFGAAGQPSPWLEWDQIVVADPDVVLVHPCGFDMARTLQEMPLLEHRPGWRELKAVQHDRIFVADGNQYFNRPGPRIVESLEILAEIFHPELFPSRHEGKGWMRYVAEPRVARTRPQQP